MLEYIVRPFQLRSGAVIIPSTPSAPTEKATLTWGATGTLPTAKGINVQVVCCKEGSTEQKRNSAIIRIYQDGDTSSSNYVDVARPMNVGLNKKETNSCADWDQFSGVGLEVTDALAEFASEISSGTTAGNDQPSQCQVTWNLDTGLRSNEQFLRYEQSTSKG
jgi:hypothetical protein